MSHSVFIFGNSALDFVGFTLLGYCSLVCVKSFVFFDAFYIQFSSKHKLQWKEQAQWFNGFRYIVRNLKATLINSIILIELFPTE